MIGVDQWLAGSVLLLSALLFIGRSRFRWWAGRSLVHKPEQRWLAGLADFFYFVGAPYLALLSGRLPAQFLGLTGLEHFMLFQAEGTTPIWSEIQKGAGLMFIEWLADSRTLVAPGLFALILWAGLTFSLWRAEILAGAPVITVVETIYDGLHWAFYRALFWLMTGNLYLAAILGVSLVIFESAGVAYFRQDRAPQRSGRLLKTIILIITASLFFYHPNLWMIWLIHWLMVMILKGTRTLSGFKVSVLENKVFSEQ